jgi:hypothetical protein
MGHTTEKSLFVLQGLRCSKVSRNEAATQLFFFMVQGEQIGLILAHWELIYFEPFFEN